MCQVSEDDVANIMMLVDQVISLSEYRAQLWEYLKNRMQASFFFFAHHSPSLSFFSRLDHAPIVSPN